MRHALAAALAATAILAAACGSPLHPLPRHAAPTADEPIPAPDPSPIAGAQTTDPNTAPPAPETPPTPAQAVKRALELDARAAILRNEASTDRSLGDAIEFYLNLLNLIDVESTTDDFAIAYQRYARAWQRMIAPLKHRANLRGEMDQLFAQITADADPLHDTFQRFIDRIDRAWEDVEDAARDAGIDPSTIEPATD